MTVAVMTLTTHLLRRSMHAAHSMHATANNMHSAKPHHPDPEHHISPLAALIFFLTGLVFLVLLFSVCSFATTSAI